MPRLTLAPARAGASLGASYATGSLGATLASDGGTRLATADAEPATIPLTAPPRTSSPISGMTPLTGAPAVDRKTGYVALGKLRSRRAPEVNARAQRLIRAQPRPVRTITADNGTEFHDYAALERQTGVRFYFAAPHHSWERGTNENTNGLLRQVLPKGQCLKHLTQWDCNRLARLLNRRPRKRLNYRTPEECYVP